MNNTKLIEYCERVKTSPNYEGAKRFFNEWRAEIGKESKKPNARQKRGMPYSRTMRKWLKEQGGANEQWVSDCANLAKKMMEKLHLFFVTGRRNTQRWGGIYESHY